MATFAPCTNDPALTTPGGGTGAAGRRVCGFSQGSRRRLRGAGRRPAKFFLAFFARRRRENFLLIQVSPPQMSALFTCTNTPSTWIVHTPMSSCMCGPPPPTSAPLHAMRCDGRCNRKPIGATLLSQTRRQVLPHTLIKLSFVVRG